MKIFNFSKCLKRLGLVIVCVFALIFISACKSDSKPEVAEPQPVVKKAEVQKQEFNENVFKKYVVTARVYLDYSPNNKLGLVYVNGKKVGRSQLAGKSQDELIKLVSDDWYEWVSQLPNFDKLTYEQKAVTVLAAMRFGKNRFMTSQFYHALKKGNVKAEDIYIQCVDKNGKCLAKQMTFRSLEPLKYTWMLQTLWMKPEVLKTLAQLPHHSYLMFNTKYLYEGLFKMPSGRWGVKSYVPQYPKNWQEILKRDNKGMNKPVSDLMK